MKYKTVFVEIPYIKKFIKWTLDAEELQKRLDLAIDEQAFKGYRLISTESFADYNGQASVQSGLMLFFEDSRA